MDFANDEKLRMCSAQATGVYIRLMCILHKSQDYGKLQIKESFVYTKHNTNGIQTAIQTEYEKENLYSKFAENLSKQMPFTVEVIKVGLLELDYYGVIRLDGNTLCQPRMVKDGELSEIRRKSVNKRWNGNRGNTEAADLTPTRPKAKRNKKTDTKVDTNEHTNTENEYEYENNIIESEEIGVQGKRVRAFEPPTLEDVLKYCEERGNGIDAISFYDFYEANGWVQGKQGKPLKDWKAAVRYWERNGINKNTSSDGRQQAAPAAPTGGFGEVRTDTPAKKTRHTSL